MGFEERGTSIPYTLIRKNMKNVRLRVTAEGRVVVSAPRGVPAARIAAFVHEHEAFIQKRLREVEKTRSAHYPARYAHGDAFSCLGGRLRLAVCTAPKRAAALSGGTLTLCLPEGAGQEGAKALFKSWACNEAKRIFAQRLSLLLPRFSRKSALRLNVRDMISRWGSINPKRGSISLSVHLLRCEPELIDYVITHELCHIAYPYHTPAFYAALEAHYPERKQLDKRLKAFGLAGF